MNDADALTLLLPRCAEKGCDALPVLRARVTDEIGAYDLSFACSPRHLVTFMHAFADEVMCAAGVIEP